jgi:hypothetical protein
MGYRWVVLLCIVDRAARPPLAEILRIFFVSTFVGTFLPSVGGDALRAYSIAKLHVSGADAVASVFMDRMLGVASILVMALVGLTLAHDLASNWVILASLAAAGGVCLITLPVFSARGGTASLVLTRLPPPPSIWDGCWSPSAACGLSRAAGKRPRLFSGCSGACIVQVTSHRARPWHRRPGERFRRHPADSPGHAAAGDVQRAWHRSGGVLWFFAGVGVLAASRSRCQCCLSLWRHRHLPGGILYASGRSQPVHQ